MKLYDCVQCKKKAKCSCFYLDDLEYEDSKGRPQAGTLPFCSNACLKLFCKKESEFSDMADDYREHRFLCEQQGLLENAFVKKLQAKLQQEEQFIMDFDTERKIRMKERARAVRILVEYHDGSPGSLMNIREGIYDGWKTKEGLK